MPGRYNSFVTHCKGRNLIQLPEKFVEARIATGDFKSSNVPSDNPSIHVVVDKRKLAKDEFAFSILKRRSELQHRATATVNIIRLEQKISDVATLFRVQEIEDAYFSELQFMLGENLVVARLDSFKNTFTAAEDRLIKFMSDFVIADGRGGDGFCLGAVLIHGEYDRENGSHHFRDNAGNTFDLDIDSFNTEDPKSLLQRMDGPDSLLRIFHIGHTVLRARERTVAGMRAYEWLGWTNVGEDGDKKTFKFVLETTRPKGSRIAPSIKMTFDSAQNLEDGTETMTNLSDAEAMAVWDKVVNSIQPVK